MIVFHICARASVARGDHGGPCLERDGFIHCSTSAQVVRVADALFGGRPDLVLLAVDTDALTAPLRWEAADADTFPHVYGPIDAGAILEVIDFAPGPDGFRLPARATALAG